MYLCTHAHTNIYMLMVTCTLTYNKILFIYLSISIPHCIYIYTQEKTLHMVNTEIRLIIFFAVKMEKLYTASKNKTGS